MIKQLKYKNITWIDLESPTKEDIASLTDKYNLHSLVAEELASPSARSRVDSYEDYIYLILHFPPCAVCYGPNDNHTLDVEEIDFVIGKDFLITTHYKEIPQLEELSKIFEAHFGPEKNKKEIHAGYLFFHIMRSMYQHLEEGLEYINRQLLDVEKHVFAGRERAMVSQLSEINRSLIDFRWALKSHREVLASLELVAKEFFGPNFNFQLRAITGGYERIWNMLESNRDTFYDIRQTNESLLSIKTNETMRVLTATAFIFFPLTLISGVFGMSTTFVPLMNEPSGFFIVLVFMAVVVLGMFYIAKRKEWL